MELVDLGDVIAKLRVVGGSFEVTGTETDEVNIWDASFGRARILLERDAMQLNINAIGPDGKPGMFRMHADTAGIFPLDVDDKAMDVHAFAGRSSIAGAWELDFDGTISVDGGVVPLEEFEDVEAEVQADLVSLDISEEATNEILDDIDVNLEDILTDEELDELTPDEIEEIEVELEAEIVAEVEDEVSDEIESDVETTVETTVDEVEAEFDDLDELESDVAESDGDTTTSDVGTDESHDDINGEKSNDDSDKTTVNLDDGAGSVDG